MAKNAAKRAARADALRVVKGGVFSGARSLPAETVGSPDPFVEEVIESAANQPLFADKDQALGFFIDRICDKLDDGSAERGEMQEFLRMLVETDPAFGDELLGSLPVRK
jgi:hypothetical protein